MKILDLKAFRKRLKNSMEDKWKDKRVVIYYNPKDDAGVSYVRSKKKILEECGFVVEDIVLTDVNRGKLDDIVHDIIKNKTPYLIQLPLDRSDEEQIADIELLKETMKSVTHLDIDGLLDNSELIPCTPKGIIQVIKYYLDNNNYKDMINLKRATKNTNEFAQLNILIVGRGELIGKPLAIELINRGATVTVANSSSPRSMFDYGKYDIVVLALNKRAFLKSSDIRDLKYPVLFIDCGVFVNPTNNKLEGCIQKYSDDSVYENADDNITITSVPGGVGPMTVLNVATNANILRKNTRRKR